MHCKPRSLPDPRVALLALLLCAAHACLAQQAPADADAAPREPETKPDKSYLWPALEIVGFDLLLSNYNRQFSGTSDYDVSWASIRRNLRGPWVVDNDPFRVNQFAHPYQGSLYHGAGRSAGLSYWESSALTFLGSAWWEITGENTPPAKNDQIASGIAGSFLGEPLFRMARLVRDHSDLPDGWRQSLAAAISPPLGLNHLAFGSRFDSAFDDHDPVYMGRLNLGAVHAARNDFDTSSNFKDKAFVLDYALDYGLPGKPGYTYDRPFDYFSIQTMLSSANGVENLSTRGLLFGTDYALGDNYRGIWGLYANYDYLSPQIFHVSTTALSLGTTGQWWVTPNIALQGTALAGIGYSAASTARRVVTENSEYHYGMAPRVGLSLRGVYADTVALDVSARMISLGSIARRSAGRDDISRADVAFTWRVAGRHAVSLSYLWSNRSADFPSGNRQQTVGMVGIAYTLLGRHGLNAVDWRTPSAEPER